MIVSQKTAQDRVSRRSGQVLSLLSMLVLSLFPGIAVLLTGCRTNAPERELLRFEFQHPAMGTLFTMTMFAADEESASSAAKAAFARIDALEDVMSDYQADSELMRLCDQPAGKPVPVSHDLFDALEQSQKFSKASGGAFDATIGPYTRLWRFARKRKVLATPEEMSAAGAAVGYQKLSLDPATRSVTLLVPNMRLDLGGIAKGYSADQALALLKGRGITRAFVAASGDIAIGDPPPDQPAWKIGIAAIDAATNASSGKLLLRNCGISTSGDTEQSIEIDGVRYSHILDPKTGLGLTNRIQATVIAPNATSSDTLATTVCVLGSQRGLALIDSSPGCSVLILTKDGNRQQSFASRRFKKLARAAPESTKER